MMFWVAAAFIIMALLAWLLAPLLRSRNTGGERRASYDMQVFKDQLTEVEADLGKGVLTEAEAKRSRAEVSRRLIAAADAEQTENATVDAPLWISQAVAIVLAGIISIGGLALYQRLGSPGTQDFPIKTNIALQEKLRADRAALEASRPSQSEAETIAQTRQDALQEGDLPAIDGIDPEQNAVVTQLKEALQDQPQDLVGHQMLARNLANLGRFIEAREAQDKVISILGDDASAVDHIAHAEIMISAAGGYVSPAAIRALENALALDPSDPRGRYFAGYAANQYGFPEQAYRLWTGLLEEGPQDAPWIPSIRAQIGAIAEAAGITPSSPLGGPSAEDVEAAGDMSESERTDMIRNMVAQLANRLAVDGGSAEEWARLIGAYGVLGETDQAAEIWAEAQVVFSDDTGLAVIKAAAVSAGVEP